MRRFCLFFLISIVASTQPLDDDVITEVVSNDMLDLDFEEMAAMDDDILQMNFEPNVSPIVWEPTCLSGRTDLVFLLDTCDHVTESDLSYLRDWLNTLVTSYDIAIQSAPQRDGVDKTHLSIVQYGQQPRLVMDLTPHPSLLSIASTINSIQLTGGRPNLASALEFVRNSIFNPSTSRDGARRIVVMVTKGEQDGDVINAATQLKNSGVAVFMVEAARNDSGQLRESVTSRPTKKFGLSLTGYEQLASVRNKIKWKICKQTEAKRNKTGAGPHAKVTDKCKCKDGKEGSPGARGLRGPKGARGERGNVGKTGPRGKHGNPGKKGLVGLPGPPGPRGPPGRGALAGFTTDVPIAENAAAVQDLRETERDVLKEIKRGYKGTKGEPGLLGQPGPIGPQGVQGIPGAEGRRGVSGPEGMPGPVGPTGAPGSSGLRGKIGPMGPPGPKGESGGGSSFSREEIAEIAGAVCQTLIAEHERAQSHGITGRSGRLSQSQLRSLRGPPGPPGQRGYSGPPGPQGYEGSVGPRGYPGPAGPKGSRGEKGFIGDKGVRGPSGIGVQGPAGVPGPPGAAQRGKPGKTGPAGSAGSRGPRGPRGAKGVTGRIGPPGKCSNKQCSTFLRQRRSVETSVNVHAPRVRTEDHKWWPW